MSDYDISILLPTRGRSEQLERSIYSLFELAADTNSIEILFGVDNDDAVGLEFFLSNIIPWINKNKINHKIIIFEPMGYHNLHVYLNSLAENSSGRWMFFWNDDAIMKTPNWDTYIRERVDDFKLLSVITHNEHPFSIFPIIPRQWYTILGYISQHSLNDAYVSNIAYALDIFERIPIYCDHDRADLTGNNNDQTFKNRIVLEGNPENIWDFNHPDNAKKRYDDMAKLATWMYENDLDTSWFRESLDGLRDPWEKLSANDTNNQVVVTPIKKTNNNQ